MKQLEGKTIRTLVHNNRNLIIKVIPGKIVRQAQKSGGGWKDATSVSKSVFERVWERLSRNGSTDAGKGDGAFAAACLVAEPELGVEYIKDKTPRTLMPTTWRRTPNHVSNKD